MTAIMILGWGIGGELLFGVGLELAFMAAVLQLFLLHWYMLHTERKHRSLHHISTITIGALERAMPDDVDISGSDKWMIQHATQRHKMQYGEPRQARSSR